MSQENDILNYLKSGKSITPLEALNLFGCFRLGARIWDLRQKGYRIDEVDAEQNGKHFARYYLASEREEAAARSNHIEETRINQREVNKERQLSFV